MPKIALRSLAMVTMLAVSPIVFSPAARAADPKEAERQARWSDLRTALLGDKVAVKVQPAGDAMSIDAPNRAEDAALVPVSVVIGKDLLAKGIAKLYLVVDENPAPLAGIWEFGPAGDPQRVGTRVRIESYSYIHAIAETKDGAVYETAKFVKASGGCSAPAGGDMQEAMARLGKMKLGLRGNAVPNQSVPAQVLISHPNANGMQMDQVTRNYAPANFIQQINVTYNDAVVFKMQSDISLSENPAIEFDFKPTAPGTLKVNVEDSNNRRFEQSLPVEFKAQM